MIVTGPRDPAQAGEDDSSQKNTQKCSQLTMNSWNSFILPVLLPTTDNRTLPVFLATLLSPYRNNSDLV